MLVHEQFEGEQLRKEVNADMDEFEENVCGEAEKYKLGNVIRGLHGAFAKKFMACGMAAGLDEVTLMHGWIMGYLPVSYTHLTLPTNCT